MPKKSTIIISQDNYVRLQIEYKLSTERSSEKQQTAWLLKKYGVAKPTPDLRFISNPSPDIMEVEPCWHYKVLDEKKALFFQLKYA